MVQIIVQIMSAIIPHLILVITLVIMPLIIVDITLLTKRVIILANIPLITPLNTLAQKYTIHLGILQIK